MTDRWFNSRCAIREAYYLLCSKHKTPCSQHLFCPSQPPREVCRPSIFFAPPSHHPQGNNYVAGDGAGGDSVVFLDISFLLAGQEFGGHRINNFLLRPGGQLWACCCWVFVYVRTVAGLPPLMWSRCGRRSSASHVAEYLLLMCFCANICLGCLAAWHGHFFS